MDNRLRLRKRRNDAIEIDLWEGKSNTNGSRKNGDEICGWIWIRTRSRLGPGMVEIAFRGRSRVENNSLLQPVRTYRQRNFLEMRQPIEKGCFTPYEVLENGFLYRVPFTFIVPDKLPFHACHHRENFSNVINCHLALPPSFGGFGENGNKSRDDNMCPVNLSIFYAVEATVANDQAGGSRTEEAWNFASKKIFVTPFSESKIYLGAPSGLMLSQVPSKLLAARRREITELQLESLAPRSVTIRLPSQKDAKLSTAIIPIKITFEPGHGGAPPKLRRISRKLVAHTTAHAVLFRASATGPVRQSRQRVYTCDMSLPDLNVSSLRWQTCPPAFSDSLSVTGPDSNASDTIPGVKGSASETLLPIPVSLPQDAKLAPSFESCFISRSYALEIGLSYRATRRMGRSFVGLKIPLELVPEE
ncbi:unnamed protein product [Penicillium pancosmium]